MADLQEDLFNTYIENAGKELNTKFELGENPGQPFEIKVDNPPMIIEGKQPTKQDILQAIYIGCKDKVMNNLENYFNGLNYSEVLNDCDIKICLEALRKEGYIVGNETLIPMPIEGKPAEYRATALKDKTNSDKYRSARQKGLFLHTFYLSRKVKIKDKLLFPADYPANKLQANETLTKIKENTQPGLFDKSPTEEDHILLAVDISFDLPGAGFMQLYILANDKNTGKVSLIPVRRPLANNKAAENIDFPLLMDIIRRFNDVGSNAAFLLQGYNEEDPSRYENIERAARSKNNEALPDTIKVDNSFAARAAIAKKNTKQLVQRKGTRFNGEILKKDLKLECKGYFTNFAGKPIEAEDTGLSIDLINFAVDVVLPRVYMWVTTNRLPGGKIRPCSKKYFMQMVAQKPINEGCQQWKQIEEALHILSELHIEIKDNDALQQIVKAKIFSNDLYANLKDPKGRLLHYEEATDQDTGEDSYIFVDNLISYRIATALEQMLSIPTEWTDYAGLLTDNHKQVTYSYNNSVIIHRLALRVKNIITVPKLDKTIDIENFLSDCGIDTAVIARVQKQRYIEVIQAILKKYKNTKKIADYKLIYSSVGKGQAGKYNRLEKIEIIPCKDSKRQIQEDKQTVKLQQLQEKAEKIRAAQKTN